MKCPVCKNARLSSHDAEPALPGGRCPACSGLFVAFEPYLAWRESRVPSANATEPPQRSCPVAPADTGVAKLCPACGHFMARFRIGHEVPFHIDRCGGCSGMWFEAGEWESLRSRGLHDRLHTLFSDSYQHQLVREDAQRLQEDRYRSLLGDADYQRVRDLAAWVESHPKRSILLAYIDGRGLGFAPRA